MDKDVCVPGDRTLKDIYDLMEYHHGKAYEIFFLSYPNDGTRATFGVGTTLLDFEAGTVKTAAGVVSKMSNSLKQQHKDFMRSFVINSDQDLIVQLDGNNKVPVRADVWAKMTYQRFTKVYVTATVAATGFVHASTTPENAIDMSLEFPPETKEVESITDWTAVPQNTIVASAAHDLSDKHAAYLSIQAALDTTDAHTGTKFLTQISFLASGNEDWQDYNEFVALIGTASEHLIEDNPLVAGSTDIALSGHALTTEGVTLFIEDDLVQAQGTITMGGVANADETFVIAGQTFIWKALRAATGQVTIGGSAGAAVTNIVAAIALDLTSVTAVDGAGDTVVVTAAAGGTAGNAIVFTESSTNMTVNGAGTIGTTRAGVDGVLANSELIFEASQSTNEVVALDPTSNAHTLNTRIYNIAMSQIIVLPDAAKRVRLVSDNSKSAGGSSLVYKMHIGQITEV